MEFLDRVNKFISKLEVEPNLLLPLTTGDVSLNWDLGKYQVYACLMHKNRRRNNEIMIVIVHDDTQFDSIFEKGFKYFDTVAMNKLLLKYSGYQLGKGVNK